MEEIGLADELTEHLQRSAQGSLILLFGQVTSTVIAAIASIIVAVFLGSTIYGQLTIAMMPITVASMFTDLGIGSGLVKYIAQYRTEYRMADIRTLLKAGLVINSATGLILLLSTFMLSGYLAKTVFDQLELQLLIQVASVNLLTQSLIKIARSVFIGYERMEFVSLTVIVYSVMKSVLAPCLVFFGMGAFGSVLGNSASFSITAAICLVLITTVFLNKMGGDESSLGHVEGAKLLLVYGFPLFLSTLMGGALSRVNNLLMALNVDAFDVGNYKAATNFSVLITFFTMPIATVLFPLFSKFGNRENDKLSLVYKNSVKYATLLVVPVTSMLMLLSEPIVRIIYGLSYPDTAFYLKLFCINFLFVGLGGLANGSLLNGQGKSKIVFITNALNFCFGLPLGFLLIPEYGVQGLLITSIIATKAGLVYGLWWIKRNLGFTVNWRISAKIYLSSAISCVGIYYLFRIIRLGEWVSLLLGGGLYVLFYLFLIFGFRTLVLEDIHDLRRIFSTMGPLTPVFNVFLAFFEKTLRK